MRAWAREAEQLKLLSLGLLRESRRLPVPGRGDLDRMIRLALQAVAEGAGDGTASSQEPQVREAVGDDALTRDLLARSAFPEAFNDSEQVIDAGSLAVGTRLMGRYRQEVYICVVEAGHQYRLEGTGERFSSLAEAGAYVTGGKARGWRWLSLKGEPVVEAAEAMNESRKNL